MYVVVKGVVVRSKACAKSTKPIPFKNKKKTLIFKPEQIHTSYKKATVWPKMSTFSISCSSDI